MTTFDPYRTGINRAVREIRREHLARLIKERDAGAIYNYCFMKATERDALAAQHDMCVHGISVIHLTEDKCLRAYNLTNLWTSRILRWWRLSQ